jgi:peptidoglycan LD-endopeptidase CwlK
MPSFSSASKQKLDECVPELQILFNEVVKGFDCTILCGHRDKAAQDKAVHDGVSKAPWPTSKHNPFPSEAVDVMPYPLEWNNTERLMEFSQYVKAKARELSIDIQWGGDFKKFFDGPHWEVVK